MADRTFIDDFTRIYSFVDRVLVSCPHCSRCAVLTCRNKCLICPHCGRTKSNINWDVIGPKSLVHGLSLFLQADCVGQNLWAFNNEHLQFLRRYVAADQRVHVRDENGWSNRSLTNRLPKWMTSAKNRDQVLRAIDRLAALNGS